MKFKKNKISINDSESSFLFNIFIILVGCVLLPISTFIQILFLVSKKYSLLIAIDSSLLFVLIIVVLYFFLKTICSKVIINKDNIKVSNMLVFKKIILNENIKEVKVDTFSKNSRILNDLWGKTIFVYNNDNKLVLKFAYNKTAFELINHLIAKKEELTEE